MLVIVGLLIVRVALLVACVDHCFSCVKFSVLRMVEFAICYIFCLRFCVSSAFDVLMFISFSFLFFLTALHSGLQMTFQLFCL